MTPSSRQLRRSGRLNVIVVIGPSFSTRKFSGIWLGSVRVALLRRNAPVQLFNFFTLSLFHRLSRPRSILNKCFFYSRAERWPSGRRHQIANSVQPVLPDQVTP